MNSTLDQPEPDVWPQLAPLLDEAVAQLGEAERNAVVLRFYRQEPLEEVGRALGLSAGAAQKRVSRALEKLRKYFARRGVESSGDAIAGAISANSIQAAPAALAKVATAAALAKSVAGGGVTGGLVKATLLAMKVKSLAVMTATVVIVAGISAWLAGWHFFHKTAAAPPPVRTSDVVPIKFSNGDFRSPADYGQLALLAGAADTGDSFLSETDPDTRRTTNSAPAGHIKSLVDLPVVGAREWYLSPNNPFAGTRFVRYFIGANSSLFGKRIRISGWMKGANVQSWAGLSVGVASLGGHLFAFGDSTSDPIHGTTDWRQVEFVTDIPREPCALYFAAELYGNGEIWFDDFQVDVVSPDTPISDDRTWRFLGPNPADYDIHYDGNVKHDGHSALCLAYLPPGNAPPNTRIWWGHCLRTPDCDKYRGHTVRMSAWMKCEDLGRALPGFTPEGDDGIAISQGKWAGKPLTHTKDWTLLTVTCAVPEETQYIDTGFHFWGRGKVWIDMDSIQYEVVQ